MSRPGFEPGPPAWEASTLEKSHLDSLSAGYSEPLLSRHLLTTFGLYMGALVHMPSIWTHKLGSRPNSPCKCRTLNVHQALASPRVLNHVGVTTIEDLTRVISILI
jgi:hypothetical protein